MGWNPIKDIKKGLSKFEDNVKNSLVGKKQRASKDERARGLQAAEMLKQADNLAGSNNAFLKNMRATPGRVGAARGVVNADHAMGGAERFRTEHRPSVSPVNGLVGRLPGAEARGLALASATEGVKEGELGALLGLSGQGRKVATNINAARSALGSQHLQQQLADSSRRIARGQDIAGGLSLLGVKGYDAWQNRDRGDAGVGLQLPGGGLGAGVPMPGGGQPPPFAPPGSYGPPILGGRI